MRFVIAQNEALNNRSSLWFVFNSDRLLVSKKNNQVTLPQSVDVTSLNLAGLRIHYLGDYASVPAFAVELPSHQLIPEGLEFLGLRQLFTAVGEDLFNLAGRARQIIHWDSTHCFCGRCGNPYEDKTDERAKVCPDCGQISYPVLAPAIIVAITKGEQILLARGNRFAAPMYSVLAGFVEPGETLEDCVRREVKEEVGLEVKNIKYFGSQPWPFPNSLMIGFTAEYAAGEICIEPNEIVDAGWYTADSLPLLPDNVSIARRLINQYIEKSRA